MDYYASLVGRSEGFVLEVRDGGADGVGEGGRYGDGSAVRKWVTLFSVCFLGFVGAFGFGLVGGGFVCSFVCSVCLRGAAPGVRCWRYGVGEGRRRRVWKLNCFWAMRRKANEAV